MERLYFVQIVKALQNVELTNNYCINRLQVYCNSHRDRQEVVLMCRNEYGSDWDTGTAVLYLTKLPLWMRQIIIRHDGEMIGINDDGE